MILPALSHRLILSSVPSRRFNAPTPPSACSSARIYPLFDLPIHQASGFQPRDCLNLVPTSTDHPPQRSPFPTCHGISSLDQPIQFLHSLSSAHLPSLADWSCSPGHPSHRYPSDFPTRRHTCTPHCVPSFQLPWVFSRLLVSLARPGCQPLFLNHGIFPHRPLHLLSSSRPGVHLDASLSTLLPSASFLPLSLPLHPRLRQSRLAHPPYASIIAARITVPSSSMP